MATLKQLFKPDREVFKIVRPRFEPTSDQFILEIVGVSILKSTRRKTGGPSFLNEIALHQPIECPLHTAFGRLHTREGRIGKSDIRGDANTDVRIDRRNGDEEWKALSVTSLIWCIGAKAIMQCLGNERPVGVARRCRLARLGLDRSHFR